MPFTPFHMGPGAAIKAITGKYFSLIAFGFTQIAMDIEPLIRILRGDNILHGFTHTYIGALVIGVACIFLSKLICEKLIKIWNYIFNIKYLSALKLPNKISLLSASSGALLGSFSHVFLDSIMHSDMNPLSPFSNSNILLNIMPVGWLYLFCVFVGFFGLTTIIVVNSWRKWAIEI